MVLLCFVVGVFVFFLLVSWRCDLPYRYCIYCLLLISGFAVGGIRAADGKFLMSDATHTGVFILTAALLYSAERAYRQLLDDVKRIVDKSRKDSDKTE